MIIIIIIYLSIHDHNSAVILSSFVLSTNYINAEKLSKATVMSPWNMEGDWIDRTLLLTATPTHSY